MLKLGLNEVSNSEYHADNEFLSSSNLKLLLKDPEQFHKEKILGQRELQAERSSFVEGSLTHSLLLEPHLVQEEYRFWQGLRKQGAEFEAFKSANSDKQIISLPQKIRAESYRDAALKCPPAVKLLKGGVPEETICSIISDVPIKARFDYINVEAGYIADVKTSAMPVDVDTVRLTCTRWGYPLSAALYCAVAEAHYKKKFDFYFIFIGKSELVCSVYKASQATLDSGLADVSKALVLYKQCKLTGEWKLDKPKLDLGAEILEV